MLRSDFELLAPVGSMESLYAAIQGKADAIYFGVGRLNMRAHSAGRFTPDDIPTVVAAAHEHGIAVYLTVNTVLYDEDLKDAYALLERAKKDHVDAIIATDVAVLEYAKKIHLPVHLSTQLNISNTQAVRFYARYSDVVVLARELNLEQVKRIAQAIENEHITGPSGRLVSLEMFCHGALCMAVSGKCYMSLATRGKSANRGECLQPCRRAYRILDKDRDIELEVDNEYVLSPKDLKTIGFIDRMIDAGVRVFKIEGRARGPEYVRTVLECYNEAIEAKINGTFSSEKHSSWDERLSRVFNRGFWDGFYLGAKLGETTDAYGAKTTERKRFVGTCLGYFSKVGVGEFLIQAEGFKSGSKLLITGPTTGAVYVTPEVILSDEEKVVDIHKGMDITFRVQEKVREHDKLYVIEKAD